jgi:hypothetical protein
VVKCEAGLHYCAAVHKSGRRCRMNHPGILCFGEPKPGTRAKEIGFKISDYEAPPLPPQAPQPLGDVEAASLTVWTTTPEEVAERAATR